MALAKSTPVVVDSGVVYWRDGRGYLGDDTAVWDVCGDGVVAAWHGLATTYRQNAATMDGCASAGLWCERRVVAW